MITEHRKRVLEIRKRGKSGGNLSAEDMMFCQRMRKLHPKEYKEIDAEVQEWAMSMMNPLWREP